MKLQAASPSRSGSFLGNVRRPTAAPLRLQQQALPFLIVTQQNTAMATATDNTELENAMRARKEGMNGTVGKPALAEAQDLLIAFNKIQAEVKQYRLVNEENGKLKADIDTLRQEIVDLNAKVASKDDERQQAVEAMQQQLQDLLAQLASKEAEQQQAVEAARQELAEPLQQQMQELTAKLSSAELDKQHAVEAARHEAAQPLKLQLEDLAAQLLAKDEDRQHAVEAARRETAGPLQQQLDELSMQLQNSQAQLERLGEAVEAAESSKAAAVQALEEEKQELLLSLASATRRLADIVYPPGSLPAGLTVTTRLEGDIDLDAVTAAARTREPAAAGPEPSTSQPEPVKPAQLPPQPQQRQVLAQIGGFFGWVIGVLSFWLYQVVGALLLYYSASILRGVPPVLNLEFCLGSLVVCTLLSWANRFLMPARFAY